MSGEALARTLIRYTWALDGDAGVDELIGFFTPDAIIEGPFMGRFEGEREIRAWASTAVALREQVSMRHLLSNIDADTDGAVGVVRAYTQIVYRSEVLGAGGGLSSHVFGEYWCDARYDGARWRFVRRTVRLDGHS